MPPLYPLNLSLAADIEPAAKDTHSPPPQAAGQPERFSLKTRGAVGVDAALEQVQTILRSVKEHHLFAKGKQEKRQVLTRLLTGVGQLVVQTRSMVQRLGESRERMTHGAVTTLKTMHEVARRLVPQIVQWITT